VAVGRAIVRKPAVFLFDEPLSNLDAKLRVEMRAELNKLHHRLETTMIYVTHDQIEAMTLGDRICVMNDGELQQVAPPLEIYDRPVNRFVAGFIGTPPMNFLDGSLVAENGRLYFDEGTGRVVLPERIKSVVGDRAGQKATLGIRPETIVPRSAAPNASVDSLLSVNVNVVEPLGDDQLLYLSTDRHDIVAKVDSHVPTEVGQQIEIALDVERSHVFDAETGANLTVAPAMAYA
jgi:multiple sugar transport system ATP-binding protein